MGARRVFRLFGLLVIAGAIAAPAHGQATGSESESAPASLTEALLGGETFFNFRYRYEFVDQDFNPDTGIPFTENAHASTLRIRLNYQTASWNDWSAFGEFDYVGEVFLKDFNNTVDDGRGQYPVVQDPKGADLNQFYIDWDGLSESKIRFGRQRINLDNQRFVGGVAWRQNEQTFDSISGKFKGIPRTELFYSYVARVNRIFGERSANGTDDTNTHLLNAAIKLSADWKLVPYVYYIDSDDNPAFSTSTAGVRGGATISPRVPLPMGQTISSTRVEYSSGSVSNKKRSSGNKGVRLSKWVLSLAFSGSSSPTLSTIRSAKNFSFSLGGRMRPCNWSPVCKSNRRICEGDTYTSSGQGR